LNLAQFVAYFDLQFQLTPGFSDNFPIYKWIGPLIALFYIYRLIRQYLDNKRLLTSTVIWLVFWVAVAALAMMPDLITEKLAAFFGFRNNITAVIFVALGTIFLFIFYISAIVEKMEKQMTELVRKLALENRQLKDELKAKKKEDHADTLHS